MRSLWSTPCGQVISLRSEYLEYTKCGTSVGLSWWKLCNKDKWSWWWEKLIMEIKLAFWDDFGSADLEAILGPFFGGPEKWRFWAQRTVFDTLHCNWIVALEKFYVMMLYEVWWWCIKSWKTWFWWLRERKLDAPWGPVVLADFGLKNAVLACFWPVLACLKALCDDRDFWCNDVDSMMYKIYKMW